MNDFRKLSWGLDCLLHSAVIHGLDYYANDRAKHNRKFTLFKLCSGEDLIFTIILKPLQTYKNNAGVVWRTFVFLHHLRVSAWHAALPAEPGRQGRLRRFVLEHIRRHEWEISEISGGMAAGGHRASVSLSLLPWFHLQPIWTMIEIRKWSPTEVLSTSALSQTICSS